MEERILVQGNEAVGWGAIGAGCDGFFGYPITPQNEVPEFFAREMPKRAKVFVQSQSETGAIMMLYGGAGAGMRVMTSTSSPGWSLMQEGMSHLAAAELPAVIVVVQRGGPGQGSIRHAQMDYRCVTGTGGGGGYRNIVLAPASVQEVHDLVQLAFHLADKYSNPVVVLTDGIIGLISENLVRKTIDFGPLPDKEWAVMGRGEHPDGKRRYIHSCPSTAPPPRGCPDYLSWLEHLEKKLQTMAAGEVRYEDYRTEEADLVLVAYGYTARVCKEVVDVTRSEGLNVGLVRPITLWPYPYEAIASRAAPGVKFLVVEDSFGQMLADVRTAVGDRCPVSFLGMSSRHLPTDGGMILPDAVLEEVRRLL